MGRTRLAEVVEVISHFLFQSAKHILIVWRDSPIESTSHETWNE